MVDWDSGETLAARFRAHAGNAQHLYGYAMRAMADDWEAGGPVRTVCAGYERGPAPGLARYSAGRRPRPGHPWSAVIRVQATPTLMVTRPAVAPGSSATPRRIRSATSWAAARSAPGRIAANSSPP